MGPSFVVLLSVLVGFKGKPKGKTRFGGHSKKKKQRNGCVRLDKVCKQCPQYVLEMSFIAVALFEVGLKSSSRGKPRFFS